MSTFKTFQKLNLPIEAKKKGAGAWEISIKLFGKMHKTITNDAGAVEAAFDDSYDDYLKASGDDRFYSSQREAREALIKEVLNKNDINL